MWRHDRGRRYAFIVTYARSGSTVLQNILANQPGIHFSGENEDALAGLFASYEAARRTRAEQGSEPRRSTGDPWRGAHSIDPERYNRKLVSAFVAEILRPPAAANVIGFKEVRYFDHEDLGDYLDYIRHSFTPGLLIFNRRRAEDVARSAWWKDHPADIAAEVAMFDERTSRYAASHPDDCIVVEYERYCADPDHLRALFERLRLPYDRGQVTRILRERLEH